LECGVALVGSEVKSLRDGKAQLQDAYARIENGELFLYGAHIDPYEKAALAYNHDPRRPRKLLAHRREIKKLEGETSIKGTTLIRLAMYFKNGRAKAALGAGRGQQQQDTPEASREKEVDRELRWVMSRRQ